MKHVILVVAGLLTVWTFSRPSGSPFCGAQRGIAQPCVAQPPDGPAPQNPAPPVVAPQGRWPHEIKGYGLTVEKARQNAEDAAAARLAVHLAQQTPPLFDGPLPADGEPLDASVQARFVEYVRRHLIEGAGQRGDDVVGPEQARIKTWVLTTRDEPSWTPILSAEHAVQRRERAHERQLATGKAISLLALALLAGFAYLRLDAWTSRRHTAWLRTGAVASLALVGAAWWFA